MRPLLFVVSAAVIASSCTTSPRAVAPSLSGVEQPRVANVKGVELGDLDRRVSPCRDFYRFATGSWRAQNPIPEGKAKWSRRAAARDDNALRVRAILEDLSSRLDWPAGSVEQRVGDFYASCMNEAAVERAGLTPLAPLLAEIDGAKSVADVVRLFGRMHDLAIAVPFGITGAYQNSDPTIFLASIGAGRLGMGDRDAYQDAERRDKYRAHVAKVLALGGTPDPRAAEGVFALEKRLAEASLDAKTAEDPALTEHKMTFAELEALAPRVPWAAYFEEAKLPRGPLNVAEPKLLKQVDAELRATPIATWRAYLRFQLLDTSSPWLPAAFVDASFAAPEPRARRCAEATQALLGEDLGKKYVERWFPPAAKAKAHEMASALLGTLKDAVAGAPWMGAETKKKALEKLSAVHIELGYPDRWKGDAGLTIRRDELWGNVARARRVLVDDTRRRIGMPTDANQWLLPASSPDAYIDLQLNELVLPAGFLQPPIFDLAASDAVNYGAFGAGFAHDLAHGVDTLGAEIDALGRPNKWWTEQDQRAFEARAACVIDQYEGYFVEPGVHHRGKLVSTEALGDVTGLHLAYMTLEKSMEKRPVPVIDGFTPEQQFFVAWGQLRGEAMRIEAERDLVASDPHPTPKFRVLGPLSSLPEFQKAFACKAGDEMVRPPERRCALF